MTGMLGRERGSPLRVAMLTTVLPRALSLGGDIGSQVFVNAIRDAVPVLTVLGYDRPGELAPPVPWEDCVGERWIETSASPRRQVAAWSARSLLTHRPYSMSKYVSRRYAQRARLAIATADVVVLDHAQSGWLLPLVGRRPLIYIAHNIETEIYDQLTVSAKSAISRGVYRREARIMGTLERRLWHNARQTWTVTEEDRQTILASQPPGAVTAFQQPPAVVSAPRASRDVRFDVGLLGNWSWEANGVGLRWWLSEVLPLMPADLHVKIGGRGGMAAAGSLVREANRRSVEFLGWVPDAVEFMRTARVLAIPTQSGGGVQIKTIEAVSSGVTTVTTEKGAEGVGELPHYVSVVRAPSEFAKHVVESCRQDVQTYFPSEGHEWAKRRLGIFHDGVKAALSCIVADSAGG